MSNSKAKKKISKTKSPSTVQTPDDTLEVVSLLADLRTELTSEEQEGSTEDQADIIQLYSEPLYKKKVGTRLFSYVLFVLCLVAAGAFLSYWAPQSFGSGFFADFFHTSLGSGINYDMLGRFPVSYLNLPEDNHVFYEKELQFSGWIRSGMELLVEGQKVTVDEEGFFSYQVELQKGGNIFGFELRAGKQSKKMTRIYYYESAEDIAKDEKDGSDTKDSDAKQKQLIMQINAWPDPISVEVSSDGKAAETAYLIAGMTMIWKADDGFHLKTSDGMSTFIVLNSKQIGVLSKVPGEVEIDLDWDDVGSRQ